MFAEFIPKLDISPNGTNDVKSIITALIIITANIIITSGQSPVLVKLNWFLTKNNKKMR